MAMARKSGNKPTSLNPRNSEAAARQKINAFSTGLRVPGRKAVQLGAVVKAAVSKAGKATGKATGEATVGMLMTGEQGMHKLQKGLYKSETAALKPRHWAIRILIACVILALLYFLMAGVKPFDGGFMLLICAFALTMGAYFFFKGDVSMCGVDKVSGERYKQNQGVIKVNRAKQQWKKTGAGVIEGSKRPPFPATYFTHNRFTQQPVK
jgi:hypothetical protein